MAPNQLPYEDLESGGDVYRRKKFYNASINVGVGTIIHPINYANVLMQLGHEPLPLQLGKRWLFFGRQVHFYPNVFHYMKHIKQKSGYLGLYNGVVASACGNLLDAGLTLSINNYLDNMFPLEDSGYETLGQACMRFFKINAKQTVAKVVGVTVARPFKVIAIRKMAQFIGGEIAYRGLLAPFKVTYFDEGFAGLFSGLIPQLINELCLMWTSSLALFIFEKLYNYYLPIDPDDEDYDTKARNSSTGQIFDLILPHVVTSLFYPFDLVSTVMAINGSRLLKIGIDGLPSIPIFTGWLDCWNHLSARQQLKRGNHLFMRVCKNEENIAVKKFA